MGQAKGLYSAARKPHTTANGTKKEALNAVMYIWESTGSLIRNIEAYQIKLGKPQENTRNQEGGRQREQLRALENILGSLGSDDKGNRENLLRAIAIQRGRVEESEREVLKISKRPGGQDAKHLDGGPNTA